MDLAWCTDFCLSCDRQTDGSAYCSQSCRLADMDRSTSLSEPSTPSNIHTFVPNLDGGARSGFYLAPAINFASLRSKNRAAKRLSTESTRPYQGYFDFSSSDPNRNSSMIVSSQSQTLTPSSSQTSLASMRSTSSQQSNLSEQARTELKDYASSFDQIRDLKRRMTSV